MLLNKMCLFIFFCFCVIPILWADEIACPQCGYKNEDKDRYCLNCATEIREMSDKEKDQYEKNNAQNLIKSQLYARRVKQKMITKKQLDRDQQEHKLNSIQQEIEAVKSEIANIKKQMGEQAKEDRKHHRNRKQQGTKSHFSIRVKKYEHLNKQYDELKQRLADLESEATKLKK